MSPRPFLRVEPEDVDLLWPRLKADAVAVMGERASETMRAACAGGEAHLFQIEGGFFVVQPIDEEWDDEKQLCVYFGTGSEHGSLEAYMPLIERIAKQAGCTAICLRSKHKGMGRLLGSEWAATWTQYRKEIS